MFDINQARKFLISKFAKKMAANAKLWEQAARDAEAIVSMIAVEFSPATIYQWGSVLNKEQFCEYSDIDIAVSGLKSVKHVFEIARKADGMTLFPVQIIELEKIEPQYADIIRMKGRKVYESSVAPS